MNAGVMRLGGLGKHSGNAHVVLFDTHFGFELNSLLHAGSLVPDDTL